MTWRSAAASFVTCAPFHSSVVPFPASAEMLPRHTVFANGGLAATILPVEEKSHPTVISDSRRWWPW